MYKTWSDGKERVYLRRNGPDNWSLEVGHQGSHGIPRAKLVAVWKVIAKALAEEALDEKERAKKDGQ